MKKFEPVLEAAPKPITVPLLDPKLLSDLEIVRIAQLVQATQQSTWENHPKGRQFLRVLTNEEIVAIIREGGLYYLEDEAGVEFCCYLKRIGTVSAEDLQLMGITIDRTGTDIPVYKTGGIIVRDSKMFPRYKQVFQHAEFPDGLIIGRTHASVARQLDETTFNKIPQDEFMTAYPKLSQLYFAGRDQATRSGADMFLRLPLSPLRRA